MFGDLPLVANVAVFLVASVAVWIAGTRVTHYADVLQAHTGIGEALIGMLLLGFVSALPEAAVTLSASWAGNAQLAVNNLLGGMALNVAILAAADALVRGEALTSAIASATPLLQAALLIVMLALVAAATLIGDAQLFGVGAWSCAVLVVYLLCIRVVRRTRSNDSWIPREHASVKSRAERKRAKPGGGERPEVSHLVPKLAAGAAVILLAGYILSASGDALADQTGLGESFFGAVFLALATSLPEMSIAFSAVRIGRYEMAVSDIFGANLFGLALIFVVDLAYTGGGPVLSEVGRFSTFAALLAIAVTALFVAGLVERSHRRIMRMGLDSVAVLATYFAGLVLLYALR